MKILSIGNSFSQDAQRYLHALAKCEGVEIKTVNLYIGGCSLKTHYENISENKRAYAFEFNGEKTGIAVSVNDALMSDEWDYVTLQQVSSESGNFESYTPYIETLSDYVKEHCPNAKIILHETWAYEDGSELLSAKTPFKSAEEMLSAAQKAYRKARELISADGIIPSGTAMMEALKLGIKKIHRDTLHASLGMGRYLLSLLWYKYFTGNDIKNNKFDTLDEPITEEEREIVIKAVNYALDN